MKSKKITIKEIEKLLETKVCAQCFDPTKTEVGCLSKFYVDLKDVYLTYLKSDEYIHGIEQKHLTYLVSKSKCENCSSNIETAHVIPAELPIIVYELFEKARFLGKTHISELTQKELDISLKEMQRTNFKSNASKTKG